MSKAKFAILTALVSLATLLASVGSASACSLFHYEPPVPTSLKKY